MIQIFCDAFLERLDGPFKQQLDRYKYASRFEPAIGQQSRQDACVFLAEIDQFLVSKAGFLSGVDFGVLDAATLPFVRQFRGVDESGSTRNHGRIYTVGLDVFKFSVFDSGHAEISAMAGW